MTDTLIVYESRHGSTRRYAKWLQYELNCDLIEIHKCKKETLEPYSRIIFGSPVYFGKIISAKRITKFWRILESKKLVVLFSVSGKAPSDIQVGQYYEKSFTSNIRSRMRYFPLWGRLVLKDLNIFERLFMKLKHEEDMNHIESEMLAPIIKLIQRGEDTSFSKKFF